MPSNFSVHIVKQPYNIFSCAHTTSWGSFRYAFRYERPGIDNFVLKPLLMRSYFHGFVSQQLYTIPTEVLILERLTASPRITDIYGYCGVTTMIENLPVELTDKIQPGDGGANQTELDKLDNVYPRNQFTPLEKVQIALDMAKALADLHGFRDGVIIHGDNHIDQFLLTAHGTVKLNDFNLATILDWSDQKQQYCKREREAWAFPVRSKQVVSVLFMYPHHYRVHYLG